MPPGLACATIDHADPIDPSGRKDLDHTNHTDRIDPIRQGRLFGDIKKTTP